MNILNEQIIAFNKSSSTYEGELVVINDGSIDQGRLAVIKASEWDDEKDECIHILFNNPKCFYTSQLGRPSDQALYDIVLGLVLRGEN